MQPGADTGNHEREMAEHRGRRVSLRGSGATDNAADW